MAREPGSDGNLPSELGGTADGSDPARDRNLTQELAKLLAASIAQKQPDKAKAAPVPTNSDLASLASLVSAASGQRPLAPVFKYGLSALSYAPASKPAEPLELVHDDEPMPIPSTWRQPQRSDEDRWYRQQMGAAALGLVVGLMLVVPAVLWLNGYFDPKRARPAAEAGRPAPVPPVEIRRADARTQPRPVQPAETAAQFMTGSIEPASAPTLPARAETAKPAEPVPAIAAAGPATPGVRVEDFLAEAKRRIDSGDLLGAREVLAGADDGSQASVLFALAETYDPNMLAAWGARGVEADVDKARTLYQKALRLGDTRGRDRLDRLK